MFTHVSERKRRKLENILALTLKLKMCKPMGQHFYSYISTLKLQHTGTETVHKYIHGNTVHHSKNLGKCKFH